MARYLVTGGAGYIGSHTLVALQNYGHEAVVLDNLSNSSPESLKRVANITGRDPVFVQGDVRDAGVLRKIFTDHSIDAVIHFAGLKAVGESVQKPLEYYDNNVNGSLTLLSAMKEANVLKFVFSSSATVYGDPAEIPISENCRIGYATNPYGCSKQMVERLLTDLALSDSRWRIAILRYFNPVGAHESGLIGEHPNGIPNNLMPYISQVAIGKFEKLRVFGNDYPTPDGTCIRDYIHVMDLAEGHLSALNALSKGSGANVWNLGTGVGYSVMDMITAFKRVTGIAIPYEVTSRRSGDIAVCFSDPSKAKTELGWSTRRGLEDMMADAWRWQQQNPNGFN